MRKHWLEFGGGKFESPPPPPLGSLRIVAFGSSGFAVECFEAKGDTRSAYAMWRRVHEGTEAQCEDFARQTLLKRMEDEEAHRRHEEEVLAHVRSHPPRIVTLETLK